MDNKESGSGSERVLETLAALAALEAVRVTGGPGIETILDRVIEVLRRTHPNAFARLADLGEGDVLIDPTDLPSCLLLHLGAEPQLRLVPRGETTVGTIVRGRFAVLLDLFEGRIDGDTLFFSRDLTIEGKTELVVGLRNALDGETIDLAADLASALGPVSLLLPPARRLTAFLAGQLSQVHALLLQPVNRRVDQLERRVNKLEVVKLDKARGAPTRQPSPRH